MANVSDDLLVAELRDLAGWLDVPEAPDLRAGVRARLAAQAAAPVPLWRRRRFRRLLAAAAAVIVGTVVVVPPARTAVANVVDGILRFAGVEVIRDRPQNLPSQPVQLPSVRSAALDEARRLARFPVRAPVRLGVPESVTMADPWPDGAPRVVTLYYRGGTVKLDQFDGELEPHFQKTATDFSPVRIDDLRQGYWFSREHAIIYIDQDGRRHTAEPGLAGPTLIWFQGEVCFRLEGVASLDEAKAIAASVG